MIAAPQLERFTAALAVRYEILSEVGRGGMATVYRAQDVRHERVVALKVLGSEVVGSVATERFLAEIRTVARLNHPHILPMHDSGECEELLYYVMPFVEGEALSDRLAREGSLPVHEAVRYVQQVADGLHYAHERGLVHRDIKPGNVMLSAGHAILTDFGIAKALGELGGPALTSTGHSVGTPLYMSPEQWTNSSEVDGRSDLYSLSCVLYEMLTGKPPFDGNTLPELLAAHSIQEVTAVRRLRSDIPRTVEAAVARGMAKEASDRFDTLEEFSEALSSATPVTVPRRRRGVARWLRPGYLAPALAVAAVAVVASVLWRGESGPVSPGLEVAPDRVVVGLIQNQTQDPALDPVGPMTADWITEGLLRSGVVDVVPSLAALQASRTVAEGEAAGAVSDPAAALGLEAGAGTVISGNYYLVGDSLLLQLEVTSASSGEVLASLPRVRGSVADPTAAIGQVREAAMASLALLLDSRIETPIGAANVPPTFEAYRSFNRGLEHYLDSEWQEAYDELMISFAADTSFMLPVLYASFAISNVGLPGRADSLAGFTSRRREDLTDFHRYWLEYLEAQFDGRREEALQAIGRASDLAPTSKASYNAGWVANVVNRPRLAIEYLDRLDPERGPMRGWFHYWDQRAEALHRLSRHEEELEAARRARQLHPDRNQVLFLEGTALVGSGGVEAVDSLARVALDWPGSWEWAPGRVVHLIGSDLAFHGHTEAADALLAEAAAWFEGLPPDRRSDEGMRSQYAELLVQRGRIAEAHAVLVALDEEFPDKPQYRARRAVVAAANGDLDEVARFEPFMATVDEPYSRGWFDLARAELAAYLGRRDEAVRHLRTALANGLPYPRHPGPAFADLRGHPPFDQIWEARD